MKKKNRGRPRVLTGLQRHNAVRSIRIRGLTETRKMLAEKGVEVSLGTLCNLAREEGIELRSGRRKAA